MDIKTANRLQQLRKMNGYSQDALAEQLGISRQAISKWERAESSPDTDNLIALAELYGMTLDELLNSDKDKIIIDSNPNAAQPEQTPPKMKRPAVHGRLGKALTKFPYPVLVAILYILAGFAFKAWHPLWIVFLTIPVYYHFAGACMTKTRKGFMMAQPVPEIIVILYLILGFACNAWHPAWVLFLIIPVYYWLCGAYIKEPKTEAPKEESKPAEQIETK